MSTALDDGSLHDTKDVHSTSIEEPQLPEIDPIAEAKLLRKLDLRES
jgi:hypothetical protein